MPPKGSKKTIKVNPDFENRKQEVLEEAAERLAAMKAWVAEQEKQLLAGLMKNVASLDPAILNMRVSDFLQMPVTSGEDTANNDENEGGSLRSGRSMRAATVEEARDAPVLQQTAVRPNNGKKGRVMELRTPAGNKFACPSLITPRVGGDRLSTRPPRPDEITFSITGSPVVVPQERAIDQLHELVNADDSTMSPASRALVGNIREILRRKQMGDPV